MHIRVFNNVTKYLGVIQGHLKDALFIQCNDTLITCDTAW